MISLITLATALATRPSPFHLKSLTGMSWQPGYEPGVTEALWSGMFTDDATAAQLAGMLGASVLKLTPRLLWEGGGPNTAQGTNVSLANFLAWEVSTSPPSYSVVQACDVAAYIGMCMCVGNLTWAQTMEVVLSFLIPGSVISPATQQALNQDWVAQIQFSTCVATPQSIYTPPAVTA